jgi:phasin family protein
MTMVDETKTEQNIAAVADAASAPAAAVETAAATADIIAKPARRARKVNAKVVKAVTENNRRAVNKARRTPKPAAAPRAAGPIERTATMTNDFTQLFAGFQLPGSDKFQTLFADAGARGQELAAKSRNANENLTELAKANVEAIAEAGRIAAAGAKSIGQDVIASSRTGFGEASEAVKTLADAKSPTEFFQLQSELVRSQFDRFVSESSKLTEQVVKLAGEAIQPISNRASVNAERVNELMA